MSIKIKRHVLIRIDEELFIRIEKQAIKENRSKNNLMIKIVKNYLEGVE